MSKSRTLQHDRKKAEHLAASRTPSKTATISGFVRCAHCCESAPPRYIPAHVRSSFPCCDGSMPVALPQDELSTFAGDDHA